MNTNEINIIPRPQKVAFNGHYIKVGDFAAPYFRFDADISSSLIANGKKFIMQAFADKAAITVDNKSGEYVISMKIAPDELSFSSSPDRYSLTIDADGVSITGASDAALFYGATTLAQLVTEKEYGVYLPCIYIEDYPSYEKRGHFLECRVGSDFMTLEDCQKAIYDFALTKINYVVVGVYGCWDVQYDGKMSEYLYVPIKKYPQLSTPRNIRYRSCDGGKWVCKDDVLPTMFDEDYFGKIIEYAKEYNITVVPLFNSLGHNYLLPRLLPALSAKDESGNNTGFGVCMKCNDTYEIMFNIYDEIIDRYLAPNAITEFHIGLDEVWNMIGVDSDDLFKKFYHQCKCKDCIGKTHAELIEGYVIKILQHFKIRGIKSVYIYHDTLSHNGILTSDFVTKLKEADVYDVCVIDWWSYANNESKLFGGKTELVTAEFRGIMKPWTGYYHWDVPEVIIDNISYCAKLCNQKGFEGIIDYGAYDRCFNMSFDYLASVAWNKDMAYVPDDYVKDYAERCFPYDTSAGFEQLKKLINLQKDGGFGFLSFYSYSYLRENLPYPRQYIKEIFDKIASDDTMLSKMQTALDTAGEFMKFASDTPHTALADEPAFIAKNVYMTVYPMYEAYTAYRDFVSDDISGEEAADAIENALGVYAEFMKEVETTRLKANTYTKLRNMSITMMYLNSLAHNLRFSGGKNSEELLRDVLTPEIQWLL